MANNEPDGEASNDSNVSQRETVETNEGSDANSKEDELAVLLDKAEPEVLEEVAKELEKEVDNIPYDPYTDNREDSELSAQELSQRRNMKLYSSDGRLAGTGKTIKSIKIKKE